VVTNACFLNNHSPLLAATPAFFPEPQLRRFATRQASGSLNPRSLKQWRQLETALPMARFNPYKNLPAIADVWLSSNRTCLSNAIAIGTIGLLWLGAKVLLRKASNSVFQSKTTQEDKESSNDKLPDQRLIQASLDEQLQSALTGGQWLFRQHREFESKSGPGIVSSSSATRYSSVAFFEDQGQLKMRDTLLLVEQDTFGPVKPVLARPIELDTYPKHQVIDVTAAASGDAPVSFNLGPFDETVGFEKIESNGIAKFPKLADKAQEQVDLKTGQSLGYLTKVEANVLMMRLRARVRTLQIFSGTLKGQLIDPKTLRGEAKLTYQQAIAFSDHPTIRSSKSNDYFVQERSDWVAVKLSGNTLKLWEGLSRTKLLEKLKETFEPYPLKTGAILANPSYSDFDEPN